MRILYYGTYPRGEGYPRNETLIEGLRDAGAEVVEVRQPVLPSAADRVGSFAGPLHLVRSALQLLYAWIVLPLRARRMRPWDALVIGAPGQLDTFSARLANIGSGAPLILDAFYSLTDTIVDDRRLLAPNGLFARLLFALERRAYRCANRILIDTAAHADWLAGRFDLPRDRVAVLPVGSRMEAYPPPPFPDPDGPLHVLFIGTYIPLHGIETVLQAAIRLGDRNDLRLTLVGRGQLYDEMMARYRTGLPPWVELVDRFVPERELLAYYARAHLCLGVFAPAGKALRVVPSKVYDAAAMGRPVLTADSPAVAPLTAAGWLQTVPPADPDALADALLDLAREPAQLRDRGRAAHDWFARTAARQRVGESLIALIR